MKTTKIISAGQQLLAWHVKAKAIGGMAGAIMAASAVAASALKWRIESQPAYRQCQYRHRLAAKHAWRKRENVAKCAISALAGLSGVMAKRKAKAAPAWNHANLRSDTGGNTAASAGYSIMAAAVAKMKMAARSETKAAASAKAK
jgi:hypothetical protein